MRRCHDEGVAGTVAGTLSVRYALIMKLVVAGLHLNIALISHEDNRPDARAVKKPQQIFLSGILNNLRVQHSADTAHREIRSWRNQAGQ